MVAIAFHDVFRAVLSFLFIFVGFFFFFGHAMPLVGSSIIPQPGMELGHSSERTKS